MFRDGELLGIEPDPHAVVALAEHGDVADARQPCQLVLDLEQRVIAQIELVVAASSGELIATAIRMSGAFFLTLTRRSA